MIAVIGQPDRIIRRMRGTILLVAVACSAPPHESTPPKWVEDTTVPPPAPTLTPPELRLPGDVRPIREAIETELARLARETLPADRIEAVKKRVFSRVR